MFFIKFLLPAKIFCNYHIWRFDLQKATKSVINGTHRGGFRVSQVSHDDLVFFNYHQHEIETKRLICVTQIKPGFFSNS